jgi:ABC-2 type transport system ATP-binding protein
MIDIRHLTKKFDSVTALDDVSFSVPTGSVLGLLGHNGAGKTTVVNILSTLLKPTSGTATVAGLDVTKDGDGVRRKIGLTGQFATVDETISGRDNLVLIARLLGASRKQAAVRADDLLGVFDLTEAAKRPVRGYSGGMRRRLDLAACLVGGPEVIFLDEPTTGLDPGSRLDVWSMVEGLVAEGATVLLTTQYLEEADRLADMITVLSGGRIVASGSAAELKSEIGQLSVTTRLTPESDTEAAMTALRGAGLDPSLDSTVDRIVTRVQSSADITIVVRALDSVGAKVADVAFTEPTLDDVYLTLTPSRTDAAA